MELDIGLIDLEAMGECELRRGNKRCKFHDDDDDR